MADSKDFETLISAEQDHYAAREEQLQKEEATEKKTAAQATWHKYLLISICLFVLAGIVLLIGLSLNSKTQNGTSSSKTSTTVTTSPIVGSWQTEKSSSEFVNYSQYTFYANGYYEHWHVYNAGQGTDRFIGTYKISNNQLIQNQKSIFNDSQYYTYTDKISFQRENLIIGDEIYHRIEG